jgi:hypothetical protein
MMGTLFLMSRYHSRLQIRCCTNYSRIKYKFSFERIKDSKPVLKLDCVQSLERTPQIDFQSEIAWLVCSTQHTTEIKASTLTPKPFDFYWNLHPAISSLVWLIVPYTWWHSPFPPEKKKSLSHYSASLRQCITKLRQSPSHMGRFARWIMRCNKASNSCHSVQTTRP